MKKIKILELTNFSSGICGVFARVKEEAVRLKKRGYEVRIFSSNFVKGTDKIAPDHEVLHGIPITRFPASKLGGESYMYWKEEDKAILLHGREGEAAVLKKLNDLNFKPDLIIAHSYRHTHTVIASRIAKKLGAKSFLVTHAPFTPGNASRSLAAKLFIKFHDKFTGKSTLKRFDKIIAITKWEMPYLDKLKVPTEKIAYVPNGIPEEFFTQKKAKEENKILFLGRISPIKNLEVLIQSISLIQDQKIVLEIVGPAEEGYLKILKNLVQSLDLENRVMFLPPIYNLKQKIAKIDSAKIFVLPSKSEAMPQSLIEAQARGKIVLSSDNLGAKDLIQHNTNGLLFENGNAKDLGEKLNYALSNNLPQLKKKALESVKQFSWDKIIAQLDKLIKEELRRA